MAVSTLMPPKHPPAHKSHYVWFLPVGLLAVAYGLLGLTFTERLSHAEIMTRCVLVNPNLARIWSVGNVEIGLAYFGVFFGMLFYFLRLYHQSRRHLTDLGLAMAYLLLSFVLDYYCVLHFRPFAALLIGDAVVMTFTVIVSRQMWFQRLLGVFVPVIFLTCGLGHFLEGLSYWHLTYTVNTPWTMVTADVGFAVLVNASRFPAFIRGEDIVDELTRSQSEALARQSFFRDVLLSVTEGRLHLCASPADLPARLPVYGEPVALTLGTLGEARRLAAQAAAERGFDDERLDCLQTAVGEASMNAVVHAGGGEASVCASPEVVQVWLIDRGTGIQLNQLPRATLEQGFSTKDSLGHGFWLMLRTADRVDLLTGASGTTLVLTLRRDGNAPQPSPFLLSPVAA